MMSRIAQIDGATRRTNNLPGYSYEAGKRARIEWKEPSGRLERVTPDAIVTMPMPWPSTVWRYLVEIDEGTMTLEALKSKAERYARLMRAFDARPDPARPWLQGEYATVAVVCRSGARRDRIRKIFEAAGFTGQRGHSRIWTYSASEGRLVRFLKSDVDAFIKSRTGVGARGMD